MRTMSNAKDTHSTKHKKSSTKGPRTPSSSSSRSTPAPKSATVDLQERSPHVIASEPLGDSISSDPRTWRAPDVVQPSEDPEKLDDKIARLVAAALAKALPAALPAPVLTQGRTHLASPSVSAQDPTVGVAEAPAEQAIAVDPASPCRTGPPVRSCQGETEKRIISIDRPIRDSRPTADSSVPRVGHMASQHAQHRRPSATVSSRWADIYKFEFRYTT